MSQPASTLLQYADDLLLAAAGPVTCRKDTEDSLQLLTTLGYRGLHEEVWALSVGGLLFGIPALST